MTAHQVAVTARAEIKWMVNSAALLHRRLRYNAQEAKWWGLMRILTAALGLPLQAAATAASQALMGKRHTEIITVVTDPSHSASVRIDLARYESIFLANLSRALMHETPKRRGRPPRRPAGTTAVGSARDYGIDLGLISAALERTPAERLAMLEANSRFVRVMRRSA
jgi:hypothetical protein